MKQLIFFLFFFNSFLHHSQIWVKPNATWHYDFSTISSGGFMKIQHIADTIIESKNAMVLETTMNEFIAGQNGIIYFNFSDTLQRNYTYVNGDTIFYWRNNKFEVLYNFSEVVGGGWMLGTETQEMYMCNDTSTVDVINEEIVNISGINYKSLTLQSNNSSPYRFEGKFNERFGPYERDYVHSPWRFLFPNFASCNPGIAVEYYSFSFKCFQDDELFYNPSGEDCEYLLNHAGLTGIKNNTLSIAPNPVPSNENVTINAQGNYTIIDIQGKAIQNGTIENNSVQLINVENGIYFFILENENAVYKTKFVVR
jgi:hypothetical protein